MIFLTILFLAVVAGVGYWYLKVYTPGLMSDDNTSTTTSTTTTSTFPSAVKTLTTIPAGTIQKPQNPPRPATLSHAFSVNDQDAVSSYITKNINALSPIKSSLGYTVSDITFDGPDRAIVTYGNSRAHYSAVAVAHIDTNGNVQVTSFTILEK